MAAGAAFGSAGIGAGTASADGFFLPNKPPSASLALPFSTPFKASALSPPTLSSNLDCASPVAIAEKSMPYFGSENVPVILIGIAIPLKSSSSAPPCPLSDFTTVGFAV